MENTHDFNLRVNWHVDIFKMLNIICPNHTVDLKLSIWKCGSGHISYFCPLKADFSVKKYQAMRIQVKVMKQYCWLIAFKWVLWTFSRLKLLPFLNSPLLFFTSTWPPWHIQEGWKVEHHHISTFPNKYTKQVRGESFRLKLCRFYDAIPYHLPHS